jgi:hypothetical protein
VLCLAFHVLYVLVNVFEVVAQRVKETLSDAHNVVVFLLFNHFVVGVVILQDFSVLEAIQLVYKHSLVLNLFE